MDDFMARAQVCKARIDRLTYEARRTTDLDRLADIHAEMDVLVASMHDIQEEQIIHYMPKPKPARRTLWQRLTRPSERQDA